MCLISERVANWSKLVSPATLDKFFRESLIPAHLDLLTGHSTVSVILQLFFDEHNADAEGEKHGSASRRSAAEPPPEAGGLKLSSQAPERGAVVPVPRRQESLRLSGADRRACAETLTSELGYDSASRFEETQLKGRPTQLESTAKNVLHRHNLPRKVT